MPNYLPVIKKDFTPYLKTFLDDLKARKDKDNFRPSGVQVYIGRQGRGKTASAVHHALRWKKRYPKSILVTNLLMLPDSGLLPVRFSLQSEQIDYVDNLPLHQQEKVKVKFLTRNLRNLLDDFNSSTQAILFDDIDELAVVLTSVNNGKYGVYYLIDELQNYFSQQDSKNIPPWVLAEIAQQRKQHKCITATSQLFENVAKGFRSQVDNVIACNTYFGVLTVQTAYDGATLDQDFNGKYTGRVSKTGGFIQTRNLRNSYDTYQKVVSGKVDFIDSKPVDFSLTIKKAK